MNQELENYIKESKNSGFSDEQIKQELKKAGWKEEDINQAFGREPILNKSLTQEPIINTNKKNELKTLRIIVLVVIIFLIIGGGIFYYIKFKPFESKEVQRNQDNNSVLSEEETKLLEEENNNESNYSEESKIKDCGMANLIQNTTIKINDDGSREVLSAGDIVPNTDIDKKSLECFNDAFLNCYDSKIQIITEGNKEYCEMKKVNDKCIFSGKYNRRNLDQNYYPPGDDLFPVRCEISEKTLSSELLDSESDFAFYEFFHSIIIAEAFKSINPEIEQELINQGINCVVNLPEWNDIELTNGKGTFEMSSINWLEDPMFFIYVNNFSLDNVIVKIDCRENNLSEEFTLVEGSIINYCNREFRLNKIFEKDSDLWISISTRKTY